MQASDFDQAVNRIRKQVFGKFPTASKEMKEDLVQEGVVALLESQEQGGNPYWAIVRAISKYYWANISVVRRSRSTNKKRATKICHKKPGINDAANASGSVTIDKEWTSSEKDLPQESFDIDDLLEDIGRRAVRETLLVPTVRKTVQDREWVIIDARILSGSKKKPRPLLAKEMMISVERVRQLENQGLDRMKRKISSPSHPLHILHPSY